jgi:hypothetical protein
MAARLPAVLTRRTLIPRNINHRRVVYINKTFRKLDYVFSKDFGSDSILFLTILSMKQCMYIEVRPHIWRQRLAVTIAPIRVASAWNETESSLRNVVLLNKKQDDG